ncbi:MaoC family dehydratase [Rhodobacteraceae bacterium D3-12]|nr:MaoC family dehydratase [Rhodobacteraceae bacterium D3-12]
MFFDDLPVGAQFETDPETLSEEAIITFARQYDPQPFHTDPEAARDTIYGGVIASGFQTLLIAFNQVLSANIWADASMGSPGLDEIRFLRPVRPGDAIHVRATVAASEPSKSRPDRGRTRFYYEILNQNGEVVISYYAVQLLKRRA